MIKLGYGIVGVAVSTFIVNVISKLFLSAYVWVKMNIRPSEYIPLQVYAIYFALISAVFILIDHRIIDIQ
jgi:Na+-driven multidrug efflux pump